MSNQKEPLAGSPSGVDKAQSLTPDQTANALGASVEGLTSAEAQNRLRIYGKNTLEEEETSKLKLFLRQFKNILVYVLFAASLLTLIIGEWTDFAVIVFIILINSLIGFWQELKAETSLQALKKLTESKVKVIRDKQILFIPSSELVPGDYVTVNEGDLITADMRLSDSAGLTVDESTLTGESLPVLKDHTLILPPNTMPYELKNLLLTGTAVVRGSGKAFVTKTGVHTYFASIAEKAKGSAPISPLSKAIKFFAKRYVILLIVLLSIVGVIGLLQGREPFDVAYTLVAQLVSSVPEGLPLVVTVVVTVGAIALSKKKTLTRDLPSVETLGSATVIASDKTGTITAGKLAVKEVYAVDSENLKLGAILCNDATEFKGDPIDAALANWAEDYKEVNDRCKRLWAYPFDTQLRLMATVNDVNGVSKLFVKGAFEELKKMALNSEKFADLERALTSMAENGLRVIAFGVGEWNSKSSKLPNSWKIGIVGLVGFLDPPKEGVKEAIEIAKKAGISVIMITGDYPLTAKSIAKEVGIWQEGNELLTGLEIERIDDKELYEKLKSTTVLARILPEHKFRVVKVLQANGEIVSVTGDGVNDVPALKVADLGIAMGSGTEAAKSVSKMVILDNNLTVIVEAIKRGRVIADNIRKVIYYLLSTAIQELLLVSFAIIAFLPLPLFPIQILWINLVTDGVQDKAFPFTKEEGDVMNRPPKKSERHFFDRVQVFRVVTFGLGVGLICLFLFVYLLG
ncbi:MAG TPA: cation-transporting P-type ATPase, partial [Candidatus Acidoferrales bacterium]|nr:cation-transporting P-type ATPase [Candidatus Acidoferrales bacterium]